MSEPCFSGWCRLPRYHRGRCVRRPVRKSRAMRPLDRAVRQSTTMLRSQFDDNFRDVMQRLGVES